MIDLGEGGGAAGIEISGGGVGRAVQRDLKDGIGTGGFGSEEGSFAGDVGADIEHGAVNDRERARADARMEILRANTVEDRVIPGGDNISAPDGERTDGTKNESPNFHDGP